MQWLTIYLAFQLALLTCNAQQVPSSNIEFENQDNGLMYADSTIRTLRKMVDAQNIRYKTCDLNQTFNAYVQGSIWMVTFSSPKSNFKHIRQDMLNQIEFTSLLRKYKEFVKNSDTTKLVVQLPGNLEEDEEDGPDYLIGSPGTGFSREYQLKGKKLSPGNGNWHYYFSPKDKYDSLNTLYGYYFPEVLSWKTIPKEYARLVSYVDCMIDTTTVISLAEKKDIFDRSNRTIPEFLALNDFLNRKMNLTKKVDDYEYSYLTDVKIAYALANLKNDRVFKNLVESLADAAIIHEAGSDQLEELIAVFVSPKKALDVKRHRNVIGFCSQDQSPRIHARNIAILAAETNSWDIFLRAHLDIMNDQFTRMSDGSYAYGARKTYLRELEALNLDVVDLVLGLALRAENTAPNHYNGNIWRLGRAISESKNKDLFESRIIQMMKDPRLDEFNRGLLFILFETYLYNLQDYTITNEKLDELRKDAHNYPLGLHKVIGLLKDRKPREE